jgi:hypothetical protein
MRTAEFQNPCPTVVELALHEWNSELVLLIERQQSPRHAVWRLALTHVRNREAWRVSVACGRYRYPVTEIPLRGPSC